MCDYTDFLKNKCQELQNGNMLNSEGNYDELTIREYLIFCGCHFGLPLVKFFENNNTDEDLLKMLIKILLDESEDYSNDARYSAAHIIAKFEQSLLKKHVNEIRIAQNYKITNLKPFKDKVPK